MSVRLTRLLRPQGLEEMLAVLALAVALLVTIAAGAFAHETKAGALVLDHPWARATPDGAKVAGGFVVIRNTGTEPDRLVGGSADFAEKVEIHEMAMEGDVMRMRRLDAGLEVPAGGEIALKPGSYHVMFVGLKHGLTEGERQPGTLVFEKAGTVAVEWAVDGVGAGAADAHHNHTQ